MKRIVLLVFIIAIAIPIYGIYGTIFGVIENDTGSLISGVVSLVITAIVIIGVLYSIMKRKKTISSKEYNSETIIEQQPKDTNTDNKTIYDGSNISEQEQKKCESEQKAKEEQSIACLTENEPKLTNKYSQSVYNFIEKLMQIYPPLLLVMFNNTEIPMSSILINYYSSTQSTLLKNKILFDGLRFTESKNQELSKQVKELTYVFVQGLKKRIKESNEYDIEDCTFPVLVYFIIRNNIIKYYHDHYLRHYGYEKLEDFCKNNDDALTFANIAEFSYFYMFETDINLSFINVYRNNIDRVKQILKQIKQTKMENDLFGQTQPNKENIATNKIEQPTLSPIELIDKMNENGTEFEEYMAEYFRVLGYKATVTQKSGDYGIDIIIENDFSKIGVQAKCYSNKVSQSAVREVVAGLRHYNLSSGMVITNNYFQPAAIRLAQDNNIVLWDRDMLIKKLST